MHNDMTNKPKALVVGASGVAGSAIVAHLTEHHWDIYALSRSKPVSSTNNVTYIQADLLNKETLTQQLEHLSISHVFYAAHKKEGLLNARKPINIQRLRQQIILAGRFLPYIKWVPGAMTAYYRFTAKEAGAFDKSKSNLVMFKNLIEALLETGNPLKHLCMITGAKYYGMHLGHELYPDYKTPFDEDKTQRVPGPNWYYDVEDYLSQSDNGFSWSLFRPSFIIGAAVDSPFNFGTALAVYFVIQKLKNEPVVFWGDESASQCTWEISPAKQIAQMMVWSS
jgi:nucleoside-diphosphate-sugar epimerase